MEQIIVVGGGAAGLMAAYSAAIHGAKVLILEKMPAVGRKILITGKGRCNITNICDITGFINNIPGNGSFLYSALNVFNNEDIIAFLGQYGVKTKIERGGRVFPETDKAKDVVQAFLSALKNLPVDIVVGQAVKKIDVRNGKVNGVITKDDCFHSAQQVIVATGGASYPGTGSTGDGYRLTAELGHTIIPIRPSLVPLEVGEEWIGLLQGLSLRNISAVLKADGKVLGHDFGELLFTHYGLSGPIILSLSRLVSEMLYHHPKPDLTVEINLKPALSDEILDKRIQRDFAKFSRKALKNSLGELLPNKLISIVIDLAFLEPEKPVNQISKQERTRLMDVIQHLTFSVTGVRPISEAIVTSGGVSVKEINPKSMESKIVPGLFLIGELIDVDGLTGGYNLQAAFSTGYVAGRYAALGELAREHKEF